MFLQGVGYRTAADSWSIGNVGRNEKQLVKLSNYLDKLGLDKNSIEYVTNNAMSIPMLDVLDMKLLARVWMYVINNSLESRTSISSFDAFNKVPFATIDEVANSGIANIEKNSKNRMTMEQKEIYKNRVFATWLRYLDICLTYIARDVYQRIQ